MATVLIIAPHPDDEVLGAGGFINKSHTRGDTVVVLTVSGHLPPLYTREAYDTTVREARAAHKILGVDSSAYLEIPATMVATTPVSELNGRIHEVVEEYRHS